MSNPVQRWNVPKRVSIGRGASSEVGQYISDIGAERVFIVTDTGVRDAGVLDPVVESIEEADATYNIFDEVVPDPTVDIARRAADKFESSDSDVIVGIGGGSSLDTAKATSLLAANDGDILDYAGLGNVSNETPQSIYVPTTSGTGSEVTFWCVIRDGESDIKYTIGDVNLLADLAVVDPDLTKSAPAHIKAATGMDALTHAIEAFVSVRSQSQTSALALDSIEKIGTHLPRAVEYRSSNETALSQMAVASTQAGMAFNNPGVGAVHALSHQIGAMFGVPHGLANAVLLPYVMEYNLPQVPDEMATIADALGEHVDERKPSRREGYKAVRAVCQLRSQIRIPETLAETDAQRDRISDIAGRAMKDGSLFSNPRDTEVEDLENILESAFDGEFSYASLL